MKNKNKEYLEEIGMGEREKKRIENWFSKGIDETEFIKKLKENYEKIGDVNKARRTTYYQFAESTSMGASRPYELIVIGSSGAFITRHGKANLSEDEIAGLEPGEVPEELQKLENDKGTPQPIWSKGHNVVAKDKDGDFTIMARVLQYNENVKCEIPEKTRIVVNLNKKTDREGNVSFNWASDSEKTLKVLETDIKLSEYVPKHRGIFLGTSGKYYNKELKRLEMLFDGKKGAIWQDENHLDVSIPPFLTEVEFIGLGDVSSGFNNASEFTVVDYVDPSDLDGIEAFDFYGDLEEWWTNLDDKFKQSLNIGGNDVQQAVDADPTGRVSLPIYVIISGCVNNMNLKPHAKTGNGWIQISIEGDDPAKSSIMCFIPPEAVAEGVAIGEEVYAMFQPQYNDEEDRFTGNMIGVRCVKENSHDFEKAKEIEVKEEKTKTKKPKPEKKKEEEKPEEKDEEEEEDEDIDLNKEFEDL